MWVRWDFIDNMRTTLWWSLCPKLRHLFSLLRSTTYRIQLPSKWIYETLKKCINYKKKMITIWFISIWPYINVFFYPLCLWTVTIVSYNKTCKGGWIQLHSSPFVDNYLIALDSILCNLKIVYRVSNIEKQWSCEVKQVEMVIYIVEIKLFCRFLRCIH